MIGKSPLNRITLELAASRKVCTALTDISLSPKQLSSRQLFLFLYALRCREHFGSIVLLLENQSYNSALALRRVLYETFLRGMWISHCATAEEIERARKANFKHKFPNNKSKLEEALKGSLDERALNNEKKFYKLGSGFIHSGLHETAMYALPTHPKVAEHLSRTVRRELKHATLRVLHIFLEYYLSLMKAIRDGGHHGIDTPEAIIATASSIQNLGNHYRAEIRDGNQAD